MAKLPTDFPGFTALDEAGEATTTKLRKRIKDDTLTEIPGIGEATANRIKEKFEELDNPAGQAADNEDGENGEHLPGHDLSEPTPIEQRTAGINESNANLLANCGAVFVESGNGNYASRQAVPNPDGAPRIKVVPIGHVVPVRGMHVKDGEDEYTVQGDFGMDGKPDDWLKVRSPTTGLPFIR